MCKPRTEPPSDDKPSRGEEQSMIWLARAGRSAGDALVGALIESDRRAGEAAHDSANDAADDCCTSVRDTGTVTRRYGNSSLGAFNGQRNSLRPQRERRRGRSLSLDGANDTEDQRDSNCTTQSHPNRSVLSS
jgi:hypothetical protein